MKLRTIDWPDTLQWTAPLITPDQMDAAATARQVIDQARQRSDEIIAQAQASVDEWEADVRADYLQRYGNEFRQVLTQWAQARAQLQDRLHDHARDVAHATLQRLGLTLDGSQRLNAVIHEVLSVHLPVAQSVLRVAPDRCEEARQQLDQCLSGPAAVHLSGLQFVIEPDTALRGDELVLMGPDGARIRCSFEQIVHQLLQLV